VRPAHRTNQRVAYEQWAAGVDIDTGRKKGRVRDDAANALIHTLKRNSTTSPSAIT
jgi:hypothetical protein